MPDTERRIGKWRRSMTAHFAGREDVLDELESHLRDGIDALLEVGTSPEQAFLLVTARLGAPSAIAAEFAKTPPPQSPWLPIRLVWVASMLLLAAIVRPLVPKLTAGGLNALLAVHMGTILLGYTASLLGGVLAVAYLLTRLFGDLSTVQKESLKRVLLLWSGLAVALTGAGVLLGEWCPYEKVGWCFGLDTHEVGGIAILIWNMVMFACHWFYRRASSATRVMLVGVIGNIVVILGWLGAAVAEKHPFGIFTSYPVIVVLVASQVAVSCTAIAPAGCLRSNRF